jgi:hypothetical protein
MAGELSLESALRDQAVLVAGQDERISPDRIAVSEWVTGELVELCPHHLRFPASFDRAVWPRPSDVDESRDRNAGRLLELEPIHPCERSEGWRLAIAVLTFSGPLTSRLREMKDYPRSAPESHTGWKMIGYDVMDHGLAMSGLLNFGQLGHRAASNVIKGSNATLNEYMLWASQRGAEQFAQKMSRAVPVHGPFEVLALYLCAGVSPV